MKINENIAFARSILLKNNIKQDSEEYKDYQAIRNICGNHNGYVGILTKLRFVDNVEDLSELESIFSLLKNSNIDVNKLNKLTYDDILSMFYDELVGKKNTNYTLVYKDSEYSYFLVNNYNGILEIGSPTWCLKTKSKWDAYMEKYNSQWVVIHNTYVNKLLTPNTNYIKDYKNDKPWIRYGVSIKINSDSISWVSSDDNNLNMVYKPSNYTFFGIMNTLINIENDIKKSYYKRFKGTEELKDSKTWLKVTNKEGFADRMEIPINIINAFENTYVVFSEDYSHIPVILNTDNNQFNLIYPINHSDVVNGWARKVIDFNVGAFIYRTLLEHGKTYKSDIYLGILLYENIITLDEIKSKPNFHNIIDNWIIMDYKNSYLIVNTNISENNILTRYIDQYITEYKNPYYFLIDKKTKNPIKVNLHKENIDNLINFIFKPKVKGFFSFLNRE